MYHVGCISTLKFAFEVITCGLSKFFIFCAKDFDTEKPTVFYYAYSYTFKTILGNIQLHTQLSAGHHNCVSIEKNKPLQTMLL